MLRRAPSALALAVAAILVSGVAGATPRERAAGATIDAAALAAHIRFLSDDLLAGRAPATPGSELAMRYIAAGFERLGLEPAGDGGGWLQRFEIVGLTSRVVTPLTFKKGAASLALTPGVDSILAAGRQRESTLVRDAEVVFVGYGITAPEQRWDDYKIDVRGKVVLVMNNDPADDPALFAGKTRLYYGRWDYKYAEAARHGAAGVILIHTEPSAGYPWQVLQAGGAGVSWELPAADEPSVDLQAWVTEDAARKLVALGGADLDALRRSAESRDFQPVVLGVSASAALATTIQKAQTANVLGLLRGSDRTLGEQVVVVTAHHDHLGAGETHGDAKPGTDHIFNGALDNASGVAAMLELAEALAGARPRPRRSILFAAVGAEESGLLGSAYFCAHPIVPAGRLAATINIDGLNIWGRTTDLHFVGLGKSSLDQVVVAAAREQGRFVSPDDRPDRGSFYRSDQFNFAKIGVPAIYLKAGVNLRGHDASYGRGLQERFVAERYHQPSDELDATWRFDGAVEDLQLVATILMRVADAAALPSWRPGDEFEAARKRALAAPSP